MTFSQRTLTGWLTAAAVAVAAAAVASPVFAQAGGAAKPATAPAKKPAAPKPVKLPAGVVARVNGQDITRAQVHATLDKLGGQPLLREMMQNAIVEQQAKRLGVSVTAAEIEQRIKQMKEQFANQAMMSGKPMTFTEIANRSGISDDYLRHSIRQQLLAEKAYVKYVQQTTKTPSLDNMIKASHILIPTVDLPTAPGQAPPPNPDPKAQEQKDADAKKKATEILADIRAGKITFDAAAKANSADTANKDQGGSLGWFSRGMMVPEFENAAFALKKPGDISEPVKTNFGWHIIRLDATPATITAAEKEQMRKQQIAQRVDSPQARAEGMRAWVAQLINEATITTNPQALSGSATPPTRSTRPAAKKAASR